MRGGAEEPHDVWHGFRVIREPERTEVVANRERFRQVDHIGVAEVGPVGGGHRAGVLRVVADQAGPADLGDLGFAGGCRGSGFGFDYAFDGRVNPVGYPLVEAARVDFQVRLVGDEVGFGSGAHHSRGEDRHLTGVDFARDDGLQACDDGCGDDHGVDTGLRLESAVARAAEDPHSHGGGHAEDDPGPVGDHSGGLGADPLGEDDVGAPEAFVETVSEHGLGAVQGLLAGLCDDHQGAAPVFP